MTTKPTRTGVSPGHKAYDLARGVKPANKPAVIDHSFVADPRGGPELKAPHGVAVKDNRTISKR
jgi:hypothetical protein